jgi:hypothetical protein
MLLDVKKFFTNLLLINVHVTALLLVFSRRILE